MVKKILIARLSLAAVLVFTIPFLAAAASESRQGTEEGITMMVGTAIPPIDAAAPAKTETATFALG
jgi:hypothetical protein